LVQPEKPIMGNKHELQVQDKHEEICSDFLNQWSLERRLDFDDFLTQVDPSEQNALLSVLLKLDVELLQGAGQTVDAGEYETLGDAAVAIVRKLITGPPSLPLQKISVLCRQFDKEWQPANKSRFDDYLAQVDERARLTLLRNILQIDIKRRGDSGGNPGEKDYIDLLPQYANVIREEFLASTMNSMSMSMETHTFVGEQKAGLQLPSVVRLGDYILIKELGRGGMGIVFLATHVHHATDVALKTLPAVSGKELHRFKQEFRALADVNHPNLVGLQELQEDGGQWFFTMDLLEGVDFKTYIRPHGRLDLERLRSALSQLATVVSTLHARKIVHRDIKPGNVIVSDDGTLRLLDFGMALDVAPSGSPEDAEVGGTPAYMAPEQLDLRTTTPASDWYAVGIMLYEVLTGHLPFRGSMQAVLQAKRTADPPPIDGNAPSELAELCRQLLHRDPQLRPAQEEILQVATGQSVSIRGINVAADQQLVGRERQLTELTHAIGNWETTDHAQTIFISGRSGEGKTVLADHFLDRFRKDANFTLLAGRCYDRETLPFKALDTVIDALGSRLRTMPQKKVAKLLTADAAVLAELFPVLNRVEAIAQLPRIRLDSLELQQVRRLAVDALREIFSKLAGTTKLVCFIDDLQWGDRDSAEILLEVFRTSAAPDVLFLGTFRRDEAEASRFLQAWKTGQQRDGSIAQFDCSVGPLAVEECINLVTGIVGIDNASVRAWATAMAEETRGNPLLLSELASCYDPTREDSHLMHLEEVMERKLSFLPPDARQLLDVVAVSGHSMSLEEAAHTAGHETVPISTISKMRTERLLRNIGGDEVQSIDTYHDRIRETVLRDMDADRRQGLHVKLGDVIEAAMAKPTAETADGETVNPRVYDLAYHFFEGGDRRAFDYQLQAGEAALGAYALENAIDHLQKAAQVLPEDASDNARYRLWERLGNACNRAQRLNDALEHYQKAEPVATTSVERAVALDGIGEIHHRMGNFESAIAAFDKSLRTLGYRRSNWLPRVFLESSWALTLCTLIWVVPRYKKEEGRSKAQLASKVFYHISEIFLVKGEFVRYVGVSASSAFAAIRSDDTRSIAHAFGKLGYNNAAFSLGFFCKWMLSRATRFADRSGDEITRADVDAFVGVSKYVLGELAEAKKSCLDSLSFMNRYGESWLRLAIYHNLRHLYSVEGDFENEIECAKNEIAIGNAASDPDTICWGHYGLANALARSGQLVQAHQHMKESVDVIRGRDSWLSVSVLHNHHAFVLLQSSDYEGAQDACKKSKRLIERKFLFLDYTTRTYPFLIESLIGPKWIKPRKDAEIKRARHLATKTRFVAWRFPNIRPHAQRVIGRLQCVWGRPRRAKKYFEKAIAGSQKLGAEYDLARALLDLAAVDQQRCETLRAEAVEILKRIKAVIPYAERWQLGEHPDETCVARPFEKQSDSGEN
jgi:tetratricopeptide (TPR) repeat protein